MISFMNSSTLFRGAIIVLYLIAAGFTSYSQSKEKKGKQKVQIISANSLEVDPKKGKGAKRLIGNVGFKQGDVYMYCDSAYFFSKSNKLDAYNNVRIVQGDSLTLFGDTLHYNGNDKFAKIRGNVKLDNNQIILNCNQLDYNLARDFGYYVGGGTVFNKEEKSTLTSKQGYYYPDNKFFFFKDSVHLKHPNYDIKADTMKFHSKSETTYFLGPTYIKFDGNNVYCEKGQLNPKGGTSHFVKNASITSAEQIIKGDSIFYNQHDQVGELFGNVSIVDTTENLTIIGDYSKYNEIDSTSIVTGNVLLTQVFDTDTFYLHSDTLLSYYDSTKTHQNISAFHHVKFFKSDMQGKCDSLVFSDIDSTIKMYAEPIMWAEENQMTSDFIEIKQYDNEIKNFSLVKNAFIISEVDTTRYNQIKGKDMIGYFKESELYRINVFNNGQTIYYAKDDGDSTFIGVNKAICSNMIISLDSSSIKTITFLTQPTATLFPLNKVESKELILDGYKWYGNIRPKRKEDIFDWD
jgi:lipopolysaccharide export system protein LptA